MLRFLFIVLTILILGISQSNAQRYLILQKGSNQKSRITYHEGDWLVYKVKGVGYFMEDRIQEITPELLIMRDNIVRPEQIEMVDIRESDTRNQTIKNLSALSIGAGILLLTAETINSLYHDQKLKYSAGSLVVSSSLLAGGLFVSALKRKYFKNAGRNKIQIIYLDLEE